MPDVEFVNLLGVLAVAVVAPVLLGLVLVMSLTFYVLLGGADYGGEPYRDRGRAN